MFYKGNAVPFHEITPFIQYLEDKAEIISGIP